MDYTKLKAELDVDPENRNYSGMTNAQVAADLATSYRTRQLETLTSAEVYEAIVPSEFQALSDEQKAYVRDIIGLGSDIQAGAGAQARTVLIGAFGAGSATITALAAALLESITRASELGFGSVREGHVAYARSA